MWRRRKKRGTQLYRQLALGLLQDAMGRVEKQRGGAETPAPSGAERDVSTRVPPDPPEAGRFRHRRSA